MKRLILILGMHRSGTSMVAASLECLGAEFGERAMWTGPDNLKGFREDLDFLAINEALLESMGLTWSSLEDRDFSCIPGHGLRSAGWNLLLSRLNTFPIFGLKEPRLCRLLPFWRDIIRGLGEATSPISVSVVRAIRHPSSVAMSLAKRNGIPIDRGLELWRRYVAESFNNADPAWPKVTVEYDRMLENPKAELERIAFHLGLSIDNDKMMKFALEHIDPNMRHERLRDPLPTEIQDLWDRVRRLAA